MEQIDKLVQLITDRLLENLQDKPHQTSVCVIGKEQTVQLLAKQPFLLTTESESADYLVVDALSLDAYLRIAALCPITEHESLVLTALLNGQKVLVSQASFDTEQYKHQAKVMLQRELLQQKAKLESYGVTFYREDDLLDYLRSVEQEELKPRVTSDTRATVYKEHHSSQKQSQLITESRLKQLGLSEGDTLRLEKGAIVTALAKDYIKRHRIIVEK